MSTKINEKKEEKKEDISQVNSQCLEGSLWLKKVTQEVEGKNTKSRE